MIGFGFTIFQFFQKLKEAGTLTSGSPRNFGMSLVLLGVTILVIGIIYHLQFMLGLRRERSDMVDAGLIYGQSGYPVSFTLLVAVSLLVVGVLAIVSMTFGVGPFH